MHEKILKLKEIVSHLLNYKLMRCIRIFKVTALIRVIRINQECKFYLYNSHTVDYKSDIQKLKFKITIVVKLFCLIYLQFFESHQETHMDNKNVTYYWDHMHGLYRYPIASGEIFNIMV